MATIVLTGGGTAGHCTPNLAIIPYLKENFDKIVYIGSKKGIEKTIIQKENLEYHEIECAKFNRKICVQNLSIPFVLARSIVQAGKILDRIKPNIIFSKGGYVALPVIIASHKRKIPIISHESDLTLGLANKIAYKYSNLMLTSFYETAENLRNGKYVGPPIREKILNVSKKDSISTFNFLENKPVLLVCGGSQGAKKINQILRESLNQLLKTFEIIHICGKNNLDNSLIMKGYYQYEYLFDIEKAFNIASICVSRAGSNTLFELLALKKPCLIIPLPQTNSRGDQVENAKYFYKKGMLNLLEEDCLTVNSFCLAIKNTYLNKTEIINNIKKSPIINSAQNVAKIIKDYQKSVK